MTGVINKAFIEAHWVRERISLYGVKMMGLYYKIRYGNRIMYDAANCSTNRLSKYINVEGRRLWPPARSDKLE